MSFIPCPLSQFARQNPNAPAVIWGRRRITYSQLHSFVSTTVKALKERNIKTGSVVGLVAENSVEMVIVILSLWRLGAAACPINPRFPKNKIVTLLKKVNAALVVIDDPKALSGLHLGINKAMITDLIVFDVKDSFYKLDVPAPDLDLNQEAAIIFTSGTSGEAKAAVLTYGNLYYSAAGSNEVIRLTAGDRWVLSLPLHHVSGLGVIMRAMLAGAAIVIAPQEQLAKIVFDGKSTHVSLVPTQLHRLMNDPAFAGARHAVPLRAILLGGSAIPQNLIEESIKRNLPVYVSYGLTEMASQVATGRPAKLGEPCARLLPYRELNIIDGEICVRGGTLFKGYLDAGSITRPLDQDGWFHTGDLGEVNAQGCLTVVGRRDNMFICHGENIHPEEIESALLKVDSIAQAIVVPQEDPEAGFRPVAFIAWKHQAHMKTGQALQQFLAAELPKFKIPAAFLPWPEPAPEGIKPDRKSMAALARKK